MTKLIKQDKKKKEKNTYYVEWTPKWIAGDKIKVCSHQTGIHSEGLHSGAFCNDCGCLVGYTKTGQSTPTYAFDRKKEKVILEFNTEEINKILSSIGRKWL